MAAQLPFAKRKHVSCRDGGIATGRLLRPSGEFSELPRANQTWFDGHQPTLHAREVWKKRAVARNPGKVAGSSYLKRLRMLSCRKRVSPKKSVEFIKDAAVMGRKNPRTVELLRTGALQVDVENTQRNDGRGAENLRFPDSYMEY